MITELIEKAGASCSLGSYTRTDWSSVFFSGTMHQLCLIFTDRVEFAQFLHDVETGKVTNKSICDISVIDFENLGDDTTAITLEILTLDS